MKRANLIELLSACQREGVDGVGNIVCPICREDVVYEGDEGRFMYELADGTRTWHKPDCELFLALRSEDIEAEAVGLLVKHEWPEVGDGTDPYDAYCPECGNQKREGGHKESCAWAKVMRLYADPVELPEAKVNRASSFGSDETRIREGTHPNQQNPNVSKKENYEGEKA